MITEGIAYAMSSGAPQSGQPGGGTTFGPLVVFGLIVLVFYFLLIKPQQKQQKKLMEMRKNLRTGDKIMTTGGIFGTIDSVSKESVTLKVADKVKIEISINAVAGLREGQQKN